MSGPEYEGAPPPEVPEEFASAYHEAYRRALGADVDQVRALPPAGPVPLGTRRTVGVHASDALLARGRRTRWFPLSAAAVGAVVLVLLAYAAGRVLPDHGGPGAATSAAPRSAGTSPTGAPVKATPARSPGGWEGAVTPVGIDAVSADCTAPPAQDSAGHTVYYAPQNAADGRTRTAWRCGGDAVGQKLTLRLGKQTDVAEVGLVPGYAKTDPASGVDRYAENNRITEVRWTLGDGKTEVQRLDPDPSSRSVQLLRVPRTTTDAITLEIVSVQRGPRDTTAISEIVVSAAR